MPIQIKTTSFFKVRLIKHMECDFDIHMRAFKMNVMQIKSMSYAITYVVHIDMNIFKFVPL